MGFTERITPEKATAKSWKEHIARYVFASRFTKDMLVLDAGCGCGYGPYYLAATGARKVIGADYSRDAISYGLRHYSRRNLEFKVMNCLNLEFDDESFDVICSFEVIEHVVDCEKFIIEMHRVLKDKGVFLCSTPNRKYAVDRKKAVNPYHKRDFGLDEFRELLSIRFKLIEVLGQTTPTYQKWYDPQSARSRIFGKFPVRLVPSRAKDLLGKLIGVAGYANGFLISKENVGKSAFFLAICYK